MSRLAPRTHTLLAGIFVSLSLAYSWMFLSWAGVAPSQLSAMQGLILRTKPLEAKWKTLTEIDVESGATLPANTNVILRLPPDIHPIQRLTLFGGNSKRIRYWGYCFPAGYDGKGGVTASGFPGKMFLSEAERSWRREQEQRQLPRYSIYTPPTKRDLEEIRSTSRIRHQLEVFKPGSVCYVMSQEPLGVGTDRDGDKVNIVHERSYKTDPAKEDTDGDGLLDGVEIWSLKTDPIRRDSDGDSLIDGVEDANLNGYHDQSETNPLKADTDGDGLCDGDCRTPEERRLCKDSQHRDCVVLPYGYWRGEDRNLNGTADAGEYNPRKSDTDGDGILDDQEYYNCVLAKKGNC